MEFNLFKPKGEAESSPYPDIPLESFQNAKKYFQLIAGGEIKSLNIAPKEAETAILDLGAGKIADYVVRAHAADYIDYLNGKEK